MTLLAWSTYVLPVFLQVSSHASKTFWWINRCSDRSYISKEKERLTYRHTAIRADIDWPRAEKLNLLGDTTVSNKRSARLAPRLGGSTGSPRGSLTLDSRKLHVPRQLAYLASLRSRRLLIKETIRVKCRKEEGQTPVVTWPLWKVESP